MKYATVDSQEEVAMAWEELCKEREDSWVYDEEVFDALEDIFTELQLGDEEIDLDRMFEEMMSA